MQRLLAPQTIESPTLRTFLGKAGVNCRHISCHALHDSQQEVAGTLCGGCCTSATTTGVRVLTIHLNGDTCRRRHCFNMRYRYPASPSRSFIIIPKFSRIENYQHLEQNCTLHLIHGFHGCGSRAMATENWASWARQLPCAAMQGS